jgi:hypothetical protein
VLCRDGIVEFAQQFTASNPYRVGGPRYELNTEFSGQYRAVVTMMNDNDPTVVRRRLHPLPDRHARDPAATR